MLYAIIRTDKDGKRHIHGPHQRFTAEATMKALLTMHGGQELALCELRTVLTVNGLFAEATLIN